MADRSRAGSGRAMLGGALFVVGTLAGLFVVYVVAINVAAALRDEGGDWTQSLFAVIPAVVIGVAAFALRARVTS